MTIPHTESTGVKAVRPAKATPHTESTDVHPAKVNGIRLAAWLYVNHRKLFRQLLAKVRAEKAASSKVSSIRSRKGISGLDCKCSRTLAGGTPAQRTSTVSFRGFGGFLSDLTSAF